MDIRKLLTLLLLLVAGGVMNTLKAQKAVTIGIQVTAESQIVSGKAYILMSRASGTGHYPYINDTGTYYDIAMNNSCTEASAYYLISNGDGTWKIKNYYTNKYWGIPVYNQALAPAEEAGAGTWSLNFSNGIAYPSAPDADNTIRGLDRSSSKLWGHSTGTGQTKQVKIYELATKPENIQSGWYMIKWIDRNGDTSTDYQDSDMSQDNAANEDNILYKYVRNYRTDVTVESTNYPLYLGDAPISLDEIATTLIHFEYLGYDSGRGVDGYLRSSNGHYITQTGAASTTKSSKNYIIYRSSSVPYQSTITSGYSGNRNSLLPKGKDTTPYIGQSAENKFPVTEFYAVNPAYLGLQPWSVSIDSESDIQVTYSGSDAYGIKTVYNGGTFFLTAGVTPSASEFSVPDYNGLPKVTIDSDNHTIAISSASASDVFTITNTNEGATRGSLIYNPEASTKWVWASAKGGTFNASEANSQWVIYPTGTSGQYYLFNVGARKFALPVTGGEYGGYSWSFSDNAVAIKLVRQDDGSYKMSTVSGDIYVSISTGYSAPVINYNDEGAKFNITKVDAADESAVATPAVNQIIDNTSKLSAKPDAEGWYAIKIQSRTDQAGYTNNYLFTLESEYNNSGTYYPLAHASACKIRPSAKDATYFFHVTPSGQYFMIQLPNGRFLKVTNKFPVTGVSGTTIALNHDDTNDYFVITASSLYADAYDNFIGETSTAGRTKYDIYPINLSTAGLTAWQMVCDNAAESTLIHCTRSDVSGFTSVYKNGYIFLPSDVTPTSSDFILNGATSIDINATEKSVTFTYDPNLAITTDGVTVAQGYQTAGRDAELMMLRVTANPFKDATGATLNISLKNGTEDQISKLTLYEANSSSPEVLGTGTGAPVKTTLAEVNNPGATASLSIGNLSAGAHYYWLAATVKEDATLGAILDAAVTGITYTCNTVETTLDLTASGDPEDRGAMVFNVRAYPFLPRDNGSRVYRIPALANIMVNTTNRIVAAVDKRYDSHTDIGGSHVIDIVVRYSDDGGNTWSEPIILAKGDDSNDNTCGYGDPSLTVGADGKLYCLFAAGNTGFFYGLNRIAMCVSEDGVNWTNIGTAEVPAPKIIAPATASSDGITFTDHASLWDYFVTSGKGLLTNDGVLMYLLDAQTENGGSQKNYLLYSTDNGVKWHIDGNLVCDGANEAKLEQMNDGSLVASIRTNANRCFNRGTYTKNEDGTCTFTWTKTNSIGQWAELKTGSGNNQDIFYYSRSNEIGSGAPGASTGNPDILLHTMTAGSHANLKLFMSVDGGESWSEVCQLQPNGARYATMTKLNNGDLGILFEDQGLNATGGYTDYNHYPINFLTITADQITAWYNEMTEINTTFHIKDVSGDDLLAEQKTVHGIDSDLPKDLKRAFCTYTMYSDEAMSTQIDKIGNNADVYVKCVYDGPVDFSTAINPKWYFLHSREQGDVNPDDKFYNADGTTFQSTAQSDVKNLYSNTAYQWAFFGNPYGAQLVNRATNKPLASTAVSGENASNLSIAVTDADTHPYHEFLVYDYAGALGTAAGVTDDAFTLILKGSNLGFVEYSGILKYYSSGVSINNNLGFTGYRTANVMAIEVPTTYPVTLNSVGDASYATLYLPFDVTTDANTKAYYITTVTGNEAEMTEVTNSEIPARTAVVLVNSTSANSTLNVTNGLAQQVTESNNLLTGTLTGIEGLDLGLTTNNYSLGRKNGVIGFYKYATPINLAPYKAYLVTDALNQNSAKGFTLTFDDTPTGLEEVSSLKSQDSSDAPLFDLSGRRVNKANKGIFIQNGKKIIR